MYPANPIHSYDVYWDDTLQYVEKAVVFLKDEFEPEGSNIWSINYMKWKLTDINPAGRGFLHVMMIDEKVIGTASLTMKRVILDGKEVLGAEIGDTYSSKEYRRIASPAKLSFLSSDPNAYINKSIFGRCISEITFRAEQVGIDFVYGTPNSNSYPGYTNRLSFSDLVEYKNWSMSRYSLDLYKTEKILFKILQLPFSIFKIFKDIVFKSFIKIFKRLHYIKIYEVMPPDNEIDQLWRRLKPNTGFSLIRDAKYWKHRYSDHPLHFYRIFSIKMDGNLIALVALRVKKEKHGHETGIISEWMHTNDINICSLLRILIYHKANCDIKKYNLWVKLHTKTFLSSLLNGFIPTSRVPIIFFQSSKFSRTRESFKKMLFFIGSSDNV